MEPVLLSDLRPRVRRWLDRPLTPLQCVIGWCVATGIFIAMVSLLGGPSAADGFETLFTTWAVQHGSLACAFTSKLPMTAPLYPVLSGGVAALSHVGHGVAFPAQSAMGAHCANAPAAIGSWSLRAGAAVSTLNIGYLVWFPFLAGVVAWLRATGRGRCGWEPATLIVVALLPPVWMCVESAFHPEDLMAIGFALASLACARRDAWVAAGVLIALAVLSQQFALLVAVPLLVIAPTGRRLRYLMPAVLVVVGFALPLLSLSSGSAAKTFLTGSGDFRGLGGTLAWELHIRTGTGLLLGSRVPAVLLAALVAWWFLRHYGSHVMVPQTLMSLVAICMSIRLIFESNLFGYYFTALAVALVLIDVARGRVRGWLLAWLTMVTVVYTVGPIELDFWQLSWSSLYVRRWYPILVIATALGFLLVRLLRREIRWGLVALVGIIAGTLLEWEVHFNHAQHPLPTWFWQPVLVITGIGLVVSPLLNEHHNRSETVRGLDDVPEIILDQS